MLVQLFTKRTDRNDESMAKSCSLMVDVCTKPLMKNEWSNKQSPQTEQCCKAVLHQNNGLTQCQEIARTA